MLGPLCLAGGKGAKPTCPWETEQGCCFLARGTNSKRPQCFASYTQTSPDLVKVRHAVARAVPLLPGQLALVFKDNQPPPLTVRVRMCLATQLPCSPSRWGLKLAAPPTPRGGGTVPLAVTTLIKF